MDETCFICNTILGSERSEAPIGGKFETSELCLRIKTYLNTHVHE
jgi:hypothetical protein